MHFVKGSWSKVWEALRYSVSVYYHSLTLALLPGVVAIQPWGFSRFISWLAFKKSHICEALICKIPLSENYGALMHKKHMYKKPLSTDKGFAKFITFINCSKLGLAMHGKTLQTLQLTISHYFLKFPR